MGEVSRTRRRPARAGGRPTRVATRDIPASPDDLTAAWFTAALGERAGGATVTGVERQVIGTDIGFAGEVVRCRLDWADGTAAGAPRSVIVKLPAANPKNRASAEAVGAYEREILVYRELGPDLGLPIPAHLHSEMTPNPAPWLERVLVALFDHLPLRLLAWLTRAALSLAARSRRRYVLVLEDIEDARPPNQRDGGSVDDAHAALAVLAGFHAANWMDEGLVADHPYIQPMNRAPRLRQAAYLRNLDDFLSRFDGELPPQVVARLDGAQARLPELVDHLASPPWTVLHGDFRLDNVLFRPSGDLVVLDHQMTMSGRAAVDVAYFLTTALEATDVDEEEAMLRAYHDALVAAGVDGYDLDTLRADVETSKDVLGHSLVSFSEFLDTDMTDGDVPFAEQMARRLLGWLR